MGKKPIRERDLEALQRLSESLIGEFASFSQILVQNKILSQCSDLSVYDRALAYHSECANCISSKVGEDALEDKQNAYILDQLFESCFKTVVNGMTFYLVEKFPEDPRAKHLPEHVLEELRKFGASFQKLRSILDATRLILSQYTYEDDFTDSKIEPAQLGVVPQALKDKIFDSKRRADRLVEVNNTERRSISLIDDSSMLQDKKAEEKRAKGKGSPRFLEVLFGDLFRNLFKK